MAGPCLIEVYPMYIPCAGKTVAQMLLRSSLLATPLVGVKDIYGRQITQAATPFANTVFQSFFMLTTVQPSSFALASDFSAPLV